MLSFPLVSEQVEIFMNRTSKKSNSDILRLQHASRHEINDVLGEILERDSDLSHVVKTIEQKLDEGIYILSEHMARIIVSTKSASLYDRTRLNLFKSTWELITLYRGQYPDPEIEGTLCRQLYEFAKNNAEPRRREIVEAIRDFGSEETLSTLEAIFSENVPTFQANQILANAHGSPDKSDIKKMSVIIEAESGKEFVELIQEAIASVKNRNQNPEETIKRSISADSVSSPLKCSPNVVSAKEQIDLYSVHDLITEGENKVVEFKSSLSVNLHSNKKDPNINYSALKTIAAFLNTDGGTLIVGVGDDGTPVGIEVDNFPSEDKMALYLDNLIKKYIGPEHMGNIQHSFKDYNHKRILAIECKKSKIPVHVKEGKSVQFFIRSCASTTELNFEEGLKYVSQRFD